MKTLIWVLCLSLACPGPVWALEAPAPEPLPSPEPPAAELFFKRLSQFCGQAFVGQVAKSNPGDTLWQKARVVMHIRDCSDQEIRIPLHVDKDRSRTWVLTRIPQGLQLRHEHRHADGSLDAVTGYGGQTLNSSGTPNEQAFPSDADSNALFEAQKMPAAKANTWWLLFLPNGHFAYRLTRPGRDFQIDFDLSQPVALPPPAWGAAAAHNML